MRGVLAEPSDEHVVDAGGIERRGVGAGRSAVHHREAGLLLPERACFGDGKRAVELGVDGDCVGDLGGDADAGRAQRQIGLVQNFAALDLHLPLFFGVAVVEEDVDLGDGVEGQLARMLGDDDIAASGQGGVLLVQLDRRRAARAGGGLVGVGDHADDAALAHQGRERERQRHRATVGRGDDAVVFAQVFGVDFGHDERHIGLLAEGGRVVEGDCAAVAGGGAEFLGRGGGGGDEGDVRAVKGVVRGLADCQLLAAKCQLATGGALGRQQPQLADREAAFFHALEKFGAHYARCAHQRHCQFAQFAAHRGLLVASWCDSLRFVAIVELRYVVSLDRRQELRDAVTRGAQTGSQCGAAVTRASRAGGRVRRPAGRAWVRRGRPAGSGG